MTDRARAWRAACLLLLLLGSPGAAAQAPPVAPWVFPAGREPALLDLARPYRLGEPVGDTLRLTGLAVDGASARFLLGRAADEPPAFEVRVALRGGPDPDAPSVEVSFRAAAADAGPDAAARRLAETLSAHPPSAWAAVAVRTRSEVSPPRLEGLDGDVLVATGDLPRPPPATTLARALGEGARPLLSLLGLLLLALTVALPRRPPLLLGGALLAAALLALGLAPSLSPPRDPQLAALSERALVLALLVFALCALAVCALALLRHRRALPRPARWLPELTAILLWSLFVRLHLTEWNVLTDGGSGYSRLLGTSPGFSGIAVLLDLALPPSARGLMRPAVLATSLLAALAPAALLLLARALGAGRATAAFAGLALASLPLHAALYTSDFLQGPLLTLVLTGFALVALARRGAAPTAAPWFAGCALLAFAVWCRPDAMVLGAPLAALLLLGPGPGAPRRLDWLSAPAASALGLLLASALLRLLTLARGSWFHELEGGIAPNLPDVALLTDSGLVPIWLWLLAPLGLPLLGARAGLLAATGVAAGLAVDHFNAVSDLTRSGLEFFRYAASALPWATLAAARAQAFLAIDLPRRAGAGPRLTLLCAFALAALIASAPVWHRDLLDTVYAPRAEAELLPGLLEALPASCHLVVPDDQEGGESANLEIPGRFAFVANEAMAQGRLPRRTLQIVEASDLARAVARTGALPPAPPDAAGAPGCWAFLHSAECDSRSEDGAPSPSCEAIEENLRLRPLRTATFHYRSHRLVTRPGHAESRWERPAQRVELSLIEGVRPPGESPSPRP